jgi:hypothetical protein
MFCIVIVSSMIIDKGKVYPITGLVALKGR